MADHVHLGALQCLVHAVDLARARLILDNVVGQDALQLVRVGLQLVERGRRQLVECGVGRREHRVLAVVQRVDQVDLRVQLARRAPPSGSTASGCSTPPSQPGPVPFRPLTPGRSGAALRNPHTPSRSGRWPGPRARRSLPGPPNWCSVLRAGRLTGVRFVARTRRKAHHCDCGKPHRKRLALKVLHSALAPLSKLSAASGLPRQGSNSWHSEPPVSRMAVRRRSLSSAGPFAPNNRRARDIRDDRLR